MYYLLRVAVVLDTLSTFKSFFPLYTHYNLSSLKREPNIVAVIWDGRGIRIVTEVLAGLVVAAAATRHRL